MSYLTDSVTNVTTKRDTVVSISPAEMVDMYKTLLETEQTNYSTYVTILLGIVVAMIGYAIYWNKVGSERSMKEQLDKLVADRIPTIIAETEQAVRSQVIKDILNHDVNIYRALGASLQKPETYSYSSTWYAKALIASLKANKGRQARSLAEEIVIELTSLKATGILKVYQLKPFHEALSLLPPTLEKEKEKIELLLTGFAALVGDSVEI